MDRNYNVITFTLKSIILRRPTVVNFVDINKIWLLKQLLRTQKKVKKYKKCIKM